MKEFTAEMLQILIEADSKVKGTNEYYKFHMSCSKKYDDENRWKSICCWGIPNATGKIKTFKGNTYIIIEHSSWVGNYLVRYEVTDRVKALLNI